MENKEKPVHKSCELNWYKRARVKDASPYENVLFQKERWDFLPELMPFNDHPLWQEVNEERRKMAATYGWLIYNLKTIGIETKVISPLCYSIIEGKNQISSGFGFMRIISQTLVDESYHTLLCLEGIEGVQQKRNIPRIQLPEFNLLTNYHDALAKYEQNWEKEMVQMGMVVASEVLISDYLAFIATSETIQPLCCSVTRIHWKDELAHANVFKLIAETIMSRFSISQNEFFIDCIIQSTEWFADKEFEIWETILISMDIPRAEEIIAESKKAVIKSTNTLADRKINNLLNHLTKRISADRIYSLPRVLASAQ